MEILYKDSNRVGFVLIPHETLKHEGEMFGAFLSLVTVLHVEEHESGRGKQYYVACPVDVPLFEQLGEGEEIPEYRLEFSIEPFKNEEYEAKRINSGKFGFVAIRRLIVRVPSASLGTKMGAAKLH